jgi:hypothetical protein
MHLFTRSLVLLLVGCASISLLGCGAKRIAIKPDTKVTAGEVASVSVNWIKDKKSKFDFQLKIKNESAENIIIYLSDISCARGDVGGEVTHTFFNTGERTIDFGPRQSKSFNAVCRLGVKVREGDFKVSVAKIFSNPSEDRKTPGEVIARDINWVNPVEAE